MSRYRNYNVNDTPPEEDGDRGFIGVNMFDDPGSLPPGYVAEARNKRFVQGECIEREGVAKLCWSNRSNVFGTVQPFGIAHGSSVFTDPGSKNEWIITAAAGGVWKSRHGASSTPIILPSGEILTGRVHFIDAFNKLILQRGLAAPTLILESLDEGFKYPTPPVTPGLTTIPDSDTGIYFAGRLFIPSIQPAISQTKDVIWTSDILEYFEGSVQDDFRIHTGETDSIVGLARFNDTTIVVGKERGYHFVYNVFGNLSSATLDTVTDEYGLAAPHSFVQVGNDLWSLASLRGIVSVQQTQLNKLQAVDIPVSRAIQPLIDRIKWAGAARSVAAFSNNRAYFAVPIDNPYKLDDRELSPGGTYPTPGLDVEVIPGQRYLWTKGANDTQLIYGNNIQTETGEFTPDTSTVEIDGPQGAAVTFSLKAVFRDFPNAVLVYDTLNQAWSGYDLSDAIMIADWVKYSHAGAVRLGFISLDGFINSYERGWTDDLGTAAGAITRAQIQSRMVTRGYRGDRPGTRITKRAGYVLRTWNPVLNVRSRTQGFNTEGPVKTSWTRDRAKYMRPFDKADFNLTNSNSDYDDPHRQDYSLVLGAPIVSGQVQTGVTYYVSNGSVTYNGAVYAAQSTFVGVNDVFGEPITTFTTAAGTPYVYAPGDYCYPKATGITIGAHQEVTMRRRVNSKGRFTQLIFDTTQGRVGVRPVEVETQPTDRREGVSS